MLLKKEWKIMEASKRYLDIEKEFGYVPTDELNPSTRYIIHMYPMEDTLDEEGNLNGFRDSLFFTCKVFNPKEKTVYTMQYKDAIMVSDDINVTTKCYKDGSYMLEASTKIKGKNICIGNFQALEVKYEL